MTEAGAEAGAIRIAIIDDHAVIHDGIQAWCQAADTPISVVATYAEPAEFLAESERPRQIDVVILDLQFDRQSPNLEAVRIICERGFRVIIYSQHTDSSLVLNCLDLGAVTYLSKAEGRAHLVAAIEAAATDRSYLSPTMAKAMSADDALTRPRLSQREREVLLSWFQTESKALVAKSLFITVRTIDTHLARIRTKYAAAGRPAPTKAALVVRAIQDGLVQADEL